MVQTLSVFPNANYPDGTGYYTVIVINLDLPGATSVTADIIFHPPGPTGALGAYGAPIVLDTGRTIAIGETITYNYDGSGGAEARPGLAVDYGAIPLNAGVTVIYAASVIDGVYNYDPPYDIYDEKNIPVTIIEPDICIEKLVDCNDDQVYLSEDTGSYGDTPSWYIKVWNCGDSPLLDVMVSDTNGMSWGPFDLENPGDFWEVYYDGDPIFETTTNTAEASATDVIGGTVGPVYSSATNVVVGMEGCTPGFWKNHPACWEGYLPTQTVGSVFTIPGCLNSCNLGGKTLMQALNFGGGPGNCGAAQILLRAAVAALLNASDGDINYPMDVSAVINEVNAKLATCNRADMLGLAWTLDEYNNYGCPIDAHCEVICLECNGY